MKEKSFQVYIPGLFAIPVGLNLVFLVCFHQLNNVSENTHLILTILWAILEVWLFYLSLRTRTLVFDSNSYTFGKTQYAADLMKGLEISNKTTILYLEMKSGKKRQLQFKKDDRQRLEVTVREWCQEHSIAFANK